MTLTNATIVFPKADIQYPMERIFHTPVFSHGLGETEGITGQRGQEKSLLDRDLPAHCAVRLAQAHPGDLGPRALHPSARDRRREPRVAGFQAPLSGVNGRMTCRGDAVQPLRFDVLEHEWHRTMAGRMVVRESHDVGSSLLGHGFGTIFLT